MPKKPRDQGRTFFRFFGIYFCHLLLFFWFLRFSRFSLFVCFFFLLFCGFVLASCFWLVVAFLVFRFFGRNVNVIRYIVPGSSHQISRTLTPLPVVYCSIEPEMLCHSTMSLRLFAVVYMLLSCTSAWRQLAATSRRRGFALRMSAGGTQWTYDRKKIRNFSIIGACAAWWAPGQTTVMRLTSDPPPSHPPFRVLPPLSAFCPVAASSFRVRVIQRISTTVCKQCDGEP